MNMVDLRSQLPREPKNTPDPATHAKDSWTIHWEGSDSLHDLLDDPLTPNVITDDEAIARIKGDAAFHIRKDWGAGFGGSGLMYAYVIAPSGTVFKTRDEEEVLWHSGSEDGNARSVPIMVLASPTVDPNEAQLVALDELIQSHLDWIIYGHRDWQSTSCPGDKVYAYLQSKTDDSAHWVAGHRDAPPATPAFGPPSCSREAFLAHLADHSPASSEGATIWNGLTASHVDPAFALALFHHESRCGNEGKAVANKSWGNLRWKVLGDGSEPYAKLVYSVSNNNGFCAYPSWTVAARHFVEHLLGRDGTDFYASRGLVTVEQIVPVWAPPSDHNDPAAYIKAVLATMEELRAWVAPTPIPAPTPQYVTHEELQSALDDLEKRMLKHDHGEGRLIQ